MNLKKIGTGLAIGGGLFITYIGASYLLAPDTIVSGFGFRQWPTGDADGFFAIKGTRDLVSGVTVFALLATGQRRALATVLAAMSLIPIGDAVNVVAHDGSIATALGVHTATAAYVLATSAVLFRSLRNPATPETESVTGYALQPSS